MAGKYGSASAWFLLDGYNIIAGKLKGLAYKIEAIQERSDGLGDGAEEFTPTGLSRITLTQQGAFFDTTALSSHAALSGSVATSPQATPRLACLGFAGHTTGEPFVGLQATFTAEYEVLGENGLLTKANAKHVVSGAIETGTIIQSLATKTADWNTKSLGQQVDQGAGSSNGAQGYQQVTAFSGFTGFVGKLRDSTDDVTYADLITFANVTSAPAVERASVAGTIDRYMSFDGNVTGAGSITVFCGIVRT